jgi:hypothetical protein
MRAAKRAAKQAAKAAKTAFNDNIDSWYRRLRADDFFRSVATDKQEATDPSTDVDLDEACDLESWVRRLRFDDGSGPGGGGAAGDDALVA